MRSLIFTLSFLIVGIASGYSQYTIIDFEDIPYNQGGWNGTGEVVANAVTDGINTSANACKYTIPAGASWGNCAWIIFEDTIHYQYLDSLQMQVLAPSATQMYVKLENEGRNDEIQVECYATPEDGSAWQTVTLKFGGISGTDSVEAIYDKLAIFFNVNDAVGGEEWLYDNVVVYPEMAITGPQTAIKRDVEFAVNVYPNPVEDYLTISGLEASRVELLSVTGASIANVYLSSANSKLFVGDLNSGVYFVKVYNEDAISRTFKIVKQ